MANALYTSQSGVSKHIKDLEDELGIELFVRRGKRLLGLTEPGKELLAIVERILLDAQNVKRLAEQFANRDEGSLTIATTHTQARYALPQVVRRFKQAFPRGAPGAAPGEPGRDRGHAAVAARPTSASPPRRWTATSSLVSFPFYEWYHAVVVPAAHPLAGQAEAGHPLTLEALAEQPLITYHEGYTGRAASTRASPTPAWCRTSSCRRSTPT